MKEEADLFFGVLEKLLPDYKFNRSLPNNYYVQADITNKKQVLVCSLYIGGMNNSILHEDTFHITYLISDPDFNIEDVACDIIATEINLPKITYTIALIGF